MRNFSVVSVPQRSEAWFAARSGRLTGSCAGAMLTTIKSGEAAARRDLRMKLVTERLTGQPQEDGFVNAAMQRGIDLEPAARLAYEAVTGDMVQETGFLSHGTYLAGCSLDGHIGDFERIVSLKCPKSATHLRYLRDGRVPAEYVPQMLHELWITGATSYHFFSFDDRFPSKLQTMLAVVERDDAAVADYAKKALVFLDEVEREYQAIVTVADPAAQMQAVL